MPEPPRSSDHGGRLHRCIRDLAALNALPSMCVGRTPEEVIEIVLDALPTALSCELVVLAMPGSPAEEHTSGAKAAALVEADRAALRRVFAGPERGELALEAAGELRYLCVDLPVGAEHGRLLAARSGPLDDETDRVLVRSAANLVGTTLQTARVLDAARRKDEFLAMLGHELRNPLAPIMTAVELLGRNPSATRERTVIERHTRHLARLVDDLLDISRVTHGHVELRSEDVALDAVIERAVEIAGPLITRHGHSLRVGNAHGLTLRGDPVRLAQVFGNLLTNAAKFTPPRGRIDVQVERAGERVRVSVRDNGRGIARDQLARIFEPFVQIDRESDALRGGLGLGLAIVSNLVDHHGGGIRAHSDGPGRGAVFHVELPLVAPVQRPTVIEQPHSPATRNSVRVLVVDDNVDVAELLSDALQMEGFQTAVAYDAEAALTRWRLFSPHAAVLDVGLPYVDGYELAKTLRAQHGKKPTLIAATGYGRQQDRVRAADAGFDCHFVKPVSVQDLLQVLDQRVVGVGA